MREIWMRPVPDGDTTPINTPAPLVLALGITGLATLVLGVLPGVALHFGDLATFASTAISGAVGG